jgi:hypothetical protein
LVDTPISFEFGLDFEPAQPNRQTKNQGDRREGWAATGRKEGSGNSQPAQQKGLAGALLCQG